MAIKDNKSITDVVVIFNGTISSNGTYYTNSFDVSDYDNGITFAPYIISNGGQVNILNIQDSVDDVNFSNVFSEQIIGELPSLTSPPLSSDIVNTIGVIGTERYVRLEFEVVNYSIDFTFFTYVNANPEVSPVEIDIQSILDFNNYIDSDGDFYVDVDGDNYGAI
jgi:hypothetical protein